MVKNKTVKYISWVGCVYIR